MKIVVSTLFLILGIFLNSIELSSQSGRHPQPNPNPVGVPYRALPAEDNPYSEIWIRTQANQLVDLPNGGTYRTRTAGLLKIFYEERDGPVVVEEEDPEIYAVVQPPQLSPRRRPSTSGQQNSSRNRQGARPPSRPNN